MNLKCGTDIIEISRIKESIEKMEDRFIERVFTEKEIEYCESKNMQKYQHYAVRFAAKEAIFKAISELLENKYDISWKDLEMLNDSNGRPYMKLPKSIKEKIESVDISVSHCKEYAVAYVIIMV